MDASKHSSQKFFNILNGALEITLSMCVLIKKQVAPDASQNCFERNESKIMIFGEKRGEFFEGLLVSEHHAD